MRKKKRKKYKVLKNGRIAESNVPGKYAGWKPGKIFGRLEGFLFNLARCFGCRLPALPKM